MPIRFSNFGFNFSLRNWLESFHIYSTVHWTELGTFRWAIKLCQRKLLAVKRRQTILICILDAVSCFQNNRIFHDHTSFLTFTANNRFDLDLGEITCDVRKNIVLRITYLVHKLNLEQNNVNQNTIYGIPVYCIQRSTLGYTLIFQFHYFKTLKQSRERYWAATNILLFFCNCISNVGCSVGRCLQ